MKANWKKVLMSGLMLGTAALTLAACGGGDSDTAASDGASGKDEAAVAGDLKLMGRHRTHGYH